MQFNNLYSSFCRNLEEENGRLHFPRWPVLCQFQQYIGQDYVYGGVCPPIWNGYERTMDTRTNTSVEGESLGTLHLNGIVSV